MKGDVMRNFLCSELATQLTVTWKIEQEAVSKLCVYWN